MRRDEYERIAAVEAAHWWYAATRALLEQSLAPLLPPGARVLDAGCGPGATGSWLARHGRLVAADVEPLALQLHRAQGHDALLAAATLEHLPFADASFDAALCVTVLYHEQIADPRVAVRELARVVRPGGVVCLLEPGVRRLRRAHDRITHTARRFARADLRALLADAGLRPRRVTGAYAFLVPPALVKAALERAETASDLDTGQGLAGTVLGGVAALERRWLRNHDLPAGLSILALGVK
jgi:SAM-dependent methyltransferase